MAKQNKQVFLLGWDAADWKFISPLIDAGKMPAFQRLIENGVVGNIATITPPLSPILWTTIATGKYGDEHGILNFVEPSTEDGKRIPVSVLSRKVRAIWNILTHEGLSTHLLGWWPSYPAEPINGIVVSNHFADPGGSETIDNWKVDPAHIHPQESTDEMAELRIHPTEITWTLIRPFIPTATVEQLKDPKNHELLNAIIMMLAKCSSFHAMATHILETKEWNFIGLYLDTIDKASHYFMRYHPPQQGHISDEDYLLFKDVMTGFYMYHDMMLERIMDLMSDEAYIMILSDHGFYSDHRRLVELPKDSMAPALEHSKYGVVALKGPGIKQDERIYGASLIDITPTLLHIFGLPVGEDMSGSVLQQAFENPVAPQTIPTWEFEDDKNWGELDPSVKIDVWDAQDALKQLIELGYVDNLDESDERTRDQILFENKFHAAQIKLGTNRSESAIIDLEELAADHPKNTKVLLTLLNANLAAQRPAEARRVLMKLRDIHGYAKTPQLDFLEGRVCIQEMRPKDAREFLTKAADSEVANSDFYQTLGRVFLATKSWKDAEKVFLKAISLDEENAAAYDGLCVAKLRQKKHDAAIESGLQAIGIKHLFPYGHFHLGEALLTAKYYEHAANAFEVAVFQEPGLGLARKFLIEIYSKHLPNPERLNIHETFLKKNMRPHLTIVSGLPRSGTSMMMQMLDAGGADILTDNLREKDNNNPKGYLEYEPVKKLLKDNSWLKDSNGKTVKIILQLLNSLDMTCDYSIVVMDRDIHEVLLSQEKMLNKTAPALNVKLKETFEQQWEKITSWLEARPNVKLLYVKYTDVISDPATQANRVNLFLGGTLDEAAMAKSVDPNLYRNKSKAAENA